MTARPESGLEIPAPTDEEGYLVDPADWDEAVAEALARREGIALTDVHWRALRFMREFLDEHQVIPDARFVLRFLAEEVGAGDAARQRLFELFPYGYVKQACGDRAPGVPAESSTAPASMRTGKHVHLLARRAHA